MLFEKKISRAYERLSNSKKINQTPVDYRTTNLNSSRIQNKKYKGINPSRTTAPNPFSTTRITRPIPTTTRGVRRAAILITATLRRTSARRGIGRRRFRRRLPSSRRRSRRIDAILARPLTDEASGRTIHTAGITRKVAADVIVIVRDGLQLDGQAF